MTTTTKSIDVHLNAAELLGYINRLPKMLTNHYNIYVSGTLDSAISLIRFYGSGSICIISEDTDNPFTLNGGFSILNTNIAISLDHLKIVSTAPQSCVSIDYCANAIIVNCCELVGQKTEGSYALAASRGVMNVLDCTIKNFNAAILCRYGAIMTIRDAVASDNNTGVYNHQGGITILTGSTPQTLGGAANYKKGGLIVYDNTII